MSFNGMQNIMNEYREISINEYERKTRVWHYAFCYLPHKCLETSKWMWLTGAYRGWKNRRYDTQIFTDYLWMSKEEFVKLRLLDKV
jgi:hypothetical protein